MIAMTVSVDGALGWTLLAAAPIAALAAAWWTWSRLAVRDARVRVSIAALRSLFVLAVMVLLADPAITRSVERLPRLAVHWSGGSLLDVRDAPEGATRREALAAMLLRVRALGLERHFEIVERDENAGTSQDRAASSTLLLTADIGATDPSNTPGRTVVVTPPRDPVLPDLSVLTLQLPARAASGSAIEAVATIRARGAAGRTVVVTLSDGTRVARSASHEVSEADETFTVALGAVLQSVGWQKVTIEAAGVTGEVSLSDNRLDRWIELEPVARNVLVVESAPTWEGKFVRRALEKDATLRVDYATAVSKEAAVEVRTEEGKTEKSSPVAASPKSKPASSRAGPTSLRAILGDEKRLFGYDAIVLGPLDVSALTEADAGRLVRFVDARGGGLVILGGNGYAGSILSSRGALIRLLPAEIPAQSLNRAEGKAASSDGSVVLAPAEGFAGHPAFAVLGDDPAAVFGRLQKLGDGFLKIGALAPGAEAIAVDGASARRAPLVVSHRYGAGRVTLVAAPDTWRLSVGATTELEDVSAKFWTGLVGWTAAGARERTSLRAEPTAVPAGSPVRLILEARASDWLAVDRTVIHARAELESAGVMETVPVTGSVEVRFVAEVAEPGRFVATCALPAAGTWLVTAEVDGQETAAARVEVGSDGIDSARPDPSSEAAIEAALLARGGAVIADGNAEAVLSALGSPVSTLVRETSHPARNIWWAFVLPLLLSAEAFLRRRSGADSVDVDRSEESHKTSADPAE